MAGMKLALEYYKGVDPHLLDRVAQALFSNACTTKKWEEASYNVRELYAEESAIAITTCAMFLAWRVCEFCASGEKVVRKEELHKIGPGEMLVVYYVHPNEGDEKVGMLCESREIWKLIDYRPTEDWV